MTEFKIGFPVVLIIAFLIWLWPLIVPALYVLVVVGFLAILASYGIGYGIIKALKHCGVGRARTVRGVPPNPRPTPKPRPKNLNSAVYEDLGGNPIPNKELRK